MSRSSSDLSDTARSRLLVAHGAGETILREGERGGEMFIIEDGQVEIVKSLGPNERRLALLEQGDFFGEMALLEDLPRSASARAATDCRLLPIDASTFDQMLRDFPEIAVRMMRKLSQRLREHDEASHRAHEIAAGHFEGLSRAGVNPEPVVRRAPGATQVPRSAATASTAAVRLVHLPSGHSFPLDPGQQSIIGRYDPVTGQSPEVDLGAIDERRSLSRRHARIFSRDGRFYLREEIGTSNGTWLNGGKLSTGKEEPIDDGDRLKVGLVELVFRTAGGA